MKRTTIITAAIIGAVALTACGSDNHTANAAGQFPAELNARIELPEYQEQENDTEVSGDLVTDVADQDAVAAEANDPAKSVAADNTGNKNHNNTASDRTASNGSQNSNHVETEGPAAASTGNSGISNNGSSSNTGTTVPAAPNTSTPTEPAPVQHTHTWVSHEATGHYETQIVKDAWDEDIYERQVRDICNQCGADLTDVDITQHAKDSGYVCGGYHSEVIMVKVGTIHHDAETNQVWIEDTPAYTECSSCGARK